MSAAQSWTSRLFSRRVSKPAHYRADIDGLRALAVIPVILFHYHAAGFTGGFVGVDVFFVISGFLITGLIHDEMGKKKFSVAQFYERRVRRIFPALFLILIATAIAGVIWFFPGDLKRVGESIQATIVFGSNFLFKNTSGYWDVAAARKPLLHTWSLAVEEQYYLLFPAILYFAAKGGDRIQRLVIGAIFVISLGLSIWGVRAAPTAAFYLLPYRAWELMLGGLIAIGGISMPDIRWLRELLCAAGVALILWSVVAYSPETRFPGEAAIVPCLGAGLLIFAGGGASITSELLSSAPLRAIGLISYSLYLWHWVILVFARYILFRELGTIETVIAIAASFVAATLSWRFVELPFRDRKNFSRRAIFLMALFASLIGIGVGALFAQTNGFPQRYPPRIQAILNVKTDKAFPKADGCLDKPKKFDKNATECRFGYPGAKPSFALWGDSHAGMLQPVLAEAAIARHRAGLMMEHYSCPPALGVSSDHSPDCNAFNSAAAKRIAADPDIREVILVAYWAEYIVGTPFGHHASSKIHLSDKESGDIVSVAQNRLVYARGLDRLIRKMEAAGKRVEIVASTPEIGWPVPETLARITLRHENVDIRPTLGQFLRRQQPVFAIFEDMHRRYGVEVVYPYKILCETGYCRVTLDGKPIYRDTHHLIYKGAELLYSVLDPLLDN